jgi:diguanylate cyclase (GGDEF)-like protein
MSETSHDEAASQMAERYRVLLDICRILTGTLSPDELYRVLYEQTGRILEGSGFYISLYDSDEDRATVVFYADRGRERRVEVSYRGSASQVIREGRAARVDDREEVPVILALGGAGCPTTRSAISAPLRHEGRVLGVVSVQSYEPGAYDDADLELLQAMADVAAVALENARHVARLRRRREEADEMEAVGRALSSSLDTREVLERVITSAQKLLEADGVAVWLLEGTTARVAASGGPFALPEGLAWDLQGPVYETLVRERRPVVLDDLEESDLVPDHLRPRLRGGGAVGVPLRLGDEVAGVLSAGSARVGEFGGDALRVLERLADQASVALKNARLHQSLHTLSLTDPLTGLPNRRQLDIVLMREVAAARRGRQLAVIIFDLDNFKAYNDTRGHLAGDEALRSFGSILVDESRAMNLVARYGGDEFISVLPDSREAGARSYVERVEERVEADPLLKPGDVTVSHGVAFFDPRRMQSAEDLLRAADENLYRSKKLMGVANR